MDNFNGTGNASSGKKGGRIPKKDPAVFRYMVRFNASDNAKFLSLFDRSGMKSKAHFIVARIFNEEFKVIKIDSNAVDFHTKLTSFFSQFRSVGINYNQVVKELHSHFSEKKTLALLFKLEKLTAELSILCRKIVELANDFENKWLQK